MVLAQLIKNARDFRGLSLREVSRLTSISLTLLHSIETGKQPRPKMEILYKLAAYYNLPIDEVCVAATRIPQDVFYEIVRRPEWIGRIRAEMR